MNKTKTISVIILIFLNSNLFATPYFSNMAMSNHIEKQQVHVFGDIRNTEISMGINTFQSEMQKQVDIITNFEHALSVSGFLIIFAHGDYTGITIEDTYISWENFALIINDARASEIILASCFGSQIFSQNAGGLNHSKIKTVSGLVDSVSIAINSAIYVLFRNHEPIEMVESSINNLIKRTFNLYNGVLQHYYLSGSESGYAAAYKRQNTGSYLSTARYFWINMDQATGLIWLEIQSNLALLMAKVGHIASSIVAAAIAAILLINIGLMWLSSYNRCVSGSFCHDYKIGVQSFKYAPANNFVYSLGDDDYRLDGRIPIPATTVPYLIYNGIGSVPTNWVYWSEIT